MSFFNHHEKKSLHRTSLKLNLGEQISKLSAYSEKKETGQNSKKQTNHHLAVTNFLGNISE